VGEDVEILVEGDRTICTVAPPRVMVEAVAAEEVEAAEEAEVAEAEAAPAEEPAEEGGGESEASD